MQTLAEEVEDQAQPRRCAKRRSLHRSRGHPEFELRRTGAFRTDVATALGRIFIEEVAAHQKHRAGTSGVEHGAVNFLQRFGGSLNLNLHFHAMVLDGVFTRDEDDTARFDDAGAPTQEALQRIVPPRAGPVRAVASQEWPHGRAPDPGALERASRGGSDRRLRERGARRRYAGEARRRGRQSYGGPRSSPLRAEAPGAHLRRRSTGSIYKPRCASRPWMMRRSARRHVHRFVDPDGRLDYSRSIRLMQSLSPALRFGSVATPGRSIPRATIA